MYVYTLMGLVKFLFSIGYHQCSVNNGDCGENSLCLVADNVTRVCSGPSLSATSKAQQLDATSHDCTGMYT